MKSATNQNEGRASALQPMAVIDIGASAIRLLIAQANRTGAIRPLESLQQAVTLGADVFTDNVISLESTEACVKALCSFQKTMLEYGLSDPELIRAVATSAVREARNRQIFLDRLVIATGLHVDILDEAEVNRYTYMSVYPLLQKHPALKKNDVLILEVGGGSTELLLISKNNVVASQSYRLGSLRLRELLEKTNAAGAAFYRIMETQIRQDLQQIKHDIRMGPDTRLLMLGGEARFCAKQIAPEWNQQTPLQLDVAALDKLCEQLLRSSVDEIANRYHLTFSEAESLAPAILIYTRVAQALGLRRLLVSAATLRDGILSEMAARSSRVEEFSRQIIHSAIDLGRKYQFDQEHAEHIATVCSLLFKFMHREIALSPHYEILLRIAGLLHEIGCFVGERGHHKHSMYLILNSEIFGLSSRDRCLVALIARYHRRAQPSDLHEVYVDLPYRDKIIVQKLSAILRVADALMRTRPHKVENIHVHTEQERLIITIARTSDVTLEQIALDEKGRLFETIFGKKLILRTGKKLG